MIKNVIKTCCCFVDKAVWFVNQPQPFPLWHFDHVKRQTRIEDIIEKKFIKEIRTVRTYIDGQILIKNTMIVSCVKCYGFQLFHLSSQVNSIFDTINCRFVMTDRFSYSDDFTNDIFTGNSQFVVENYFLPRELREQLFLNDGSKTDNFGRQPLHKSCFTSLQRSHYRFFCSTCKKVYNEFFERRLHVFSSTR